MTASAMWRARVARRVWIGSSLVPGVSINDSPRPTIPVGEMTVSKSISDRLCPSASSELSSSR